LESVCYFEALRRGTVAGIAPLFYAHVAIVAVVDVVLRVVRASVRVAVAVVCAIVGGVVIGVSGGPASVEPAGVVFALASATVYALYAIGSGRLVQRTEPITTAAWVAFGAAGGIGVWSLVRGGAGPLPSGAIVWIVGVGASTAAAFVLWFVVVGRLGSARTAIIMILEAPLGIVLTSLAFGDPVSAAILVGGAFVLTGAVLAALETPAETVALEAATAP
jgi:drug/metabolite transporter (DMT)-like permease